MAWFQNFLRPAKLFKDVEFYCKECDSNKVHSDKPETGFFFTEEGEVLKLVNTQIVVFEQKIGPECAWIVFAFCHDCLNKAGYVSLEEE